MIGAVVDRFRRPGITPCSLLPAIAGLLPGFTGIDSEAGPSSVSVDICEGVIVCLGASLPPNMSCPTGCGAEVLRRRVVTPPSLAPTLSVDSLLLKSAKDAFGVGANLRMRTVDIVEERGAGSVDSVGLGALPCPYDAKGIAVEAGSPACACTTSSPLLGLAPSVKCSIRTGCSCQKVATERSLSTGALAACYMNAVSSGV